MKHTTIETPIYGVMVDFYLTPKAIQVVEKIEAQGYHFDERDRNDILGDGAEGVACPVKQAHHNVSYLLWLPRFTGSPQDWNTLAHEICHIKNYILLHIGHQSDAKNDEPEAYLTGYLTEEFITWQRS